MATKDKKPGAAVSAPAAEEKIVPEIAEQEAQSTTEHPEATPPEAPSAAQNTSPNVLVASKMQHAIRFVVSDNSGVNR
jgi:hypothetical protein